jgi:hypothetical protein
MIPKRRRGRKYYRKVTGITVAKEKTLCKE